MSRIARTWTVWLLASLIWALAAATHAQPAAAERRVALVIGNAAYTRAPLVNPRHDATDMAVSLRRLGFEVIERHDRNEAQMSSDLGEFRARLGAGAVGLFYFAGHGVQASSGYNFLLPVGVDYQEEADVPLYGLQADAVLKQMQDAGTALSIVILDACRDVPPLPGNSRGGAQRGLGRMVAPSGSLVAFATAPGRTAAENRAGRNGLYTQYLLQAIETPGLRLEDVFQQVRRNVEAASNGRQSPEEISKLTGGAFYFRPPAPAAAAGGVVAAAPPAASPGVSLADLQREEQARRQAALAAAVPALPALPAIAAGGAPLPTLRDCADCPELVVLPAGSFLMGSPPGEPGRDPRPGMEGPQRRVTLARPFAIGRLEVTQGQWRALMGDNPSRHGDCGDDCPVENVSWNDAQEFLRRLSAKTGRAYRLPTEAEWEYAARAGTTTPFHTGLMITVGQANFAGKRTVPVGGFEPNAWGLHDVHGSVWEFVQDCHGSYAQAPRDGRASEAARCSYRVIRGGGFTNDPQALRSAMRFGVAQGYRSRDTGLRVARSVE